MTEKQISTLVSALPTGEQVRGRQRICQAVKYGWTQISFWDLDSDPRKIKSKRPPTQPRLADLVGLDAGGRFDFLPSAAEEED